MFKRIVFAIAVVGLMASAAHARFAPWPAISFVGGAGVAVPLNDDSFQGNYKEAVYSTLRTEAELFHNLAVYGNYDHTTFDPVAGAEVGQVDVSGWGVGVIVFSGINETGTVRGYIELGASGNVTKGESTEWEFQPGVGMDVALTSSGASAIRPGIQWKNYGDHPSRVESFLFKVLLRLTPGR